MAASSRKRRDRAARSARACAMAKSRRRFALAKPDTGVSPVIVNTNLEFFGRSLCWMASMIRSVNEAVNAESGSSGHLSIHIAVLLI